MISAVFTFITTCAYSMEPPGRNLQESLEHAKKHKCEYFSFLVIDRTIQCTKGGIATMIDVTCYDNSKEPK